MTTATLQRATKLMHQGELDLAEAELRKVLDAEPDCCLAWYNLGQLLHHARHDARAATRCYLNVRRIEPGYALAYAGLGEVSQELAWPQRAIGYFGWATRLDPRLSAPQLKRLMLKRSVCDWKTWDDDVNQFRRLIDDCLASPRPDLRLPPFYLNLFPVEPSVHLEVARRYAAALSQRMQPIIERNGTADTPRIEVRSDARLRIGYVSPDFREHAVGRLIRTLFRHHDPDRFEVSVYSLVDVHDPVRHDIESHCHRFRDISQLSPAAAARQIRADGIDVLVDLAGYTTHSRPEIFLLQPAPVQVQYLGYPGTLGSEYVPWMIADETVVPAELVRHCSEQVVNLPTCFAMPERDPDTALTDARRGTGGIRLREQHGLPPDAFVFCCFNDPSKIDPSTFDVWMNVLEEVPDSVLWLYAGHELCRDNLRREARARGIDPARLVFAEWVPNEQHRKRLPLADLALDTFLYNGGATTIEALAAEVPVLTLPGASFVSRMTASLCRAASLPELVSETADEYRRTAIALATDRSRLSSLRDRLQLPDTPLFDAPARVREFGDMLCSLHERAAKPPSVARP
jgi:protein O-GlcNAc transferase